MATVTRTDAHVWAVLDRCQALVDEGDTEEFTFRMHTIIRWWLKQMLVSCADDPMQVMHVLARAATDVGIDTAVMRVPVGPLRRQRGRKPH
jgi:hypothetical protein